ncbi:MAG: sulfotransferase [Candidatus Thermoplasmatota archaeon]|nr:sulfotransferase [Candidatus Thermoplasmatota archaeon]
MDQDIVYIVSGLPRSGTSLMMKMLKEGGMTLLVDNIREADADNPKGYFEFERVKKLPRDASWLPVARGKVVKVLAELIKHLPDDQAYKIVFMMRDIDEIVVSQKKMMVRRGEDPEKVHDEEMRALLRSYLKNLKIFVGRKNNMDVCYISYNDLMREPDLSIEEIVEFFDGGLDPQKMREAIDEDLYRNRV